MSELDNIKTIPHDPESESENESENGTVQSSNNGSDQESVYTEVNLQEDRVYQILNTFFENEEGDNITKVLSNINENIQIQNKILNHIAQTFSNLKIGVEESEE